MRVHIFIAVTGNCLGRSRVDDIRREWPEAIDYGSIRLHGGEDDPAVLGVLRKLNEWGWKPIDPAEHYDEAKHFELIRTREYEPPDLDGLECLQIWPELMVEMEWEPAGYGIRRGQYKRRADFARGRSGKPIIVSQRVRALLETADFRGLHFAPLQLFKRVGGSYDSPKLGNLEWSSVGEPWWILDSILTLPPVGPYLYIQGGGDGKIYPRGTRQGIIREPGFSDVERHYVRSELAKLGEFDVAREWESLGAVDIIVSRRFYEFCKAHNLKCGFKPVRIDEG